MNIDEIKTNLDRDAELSIYACQNKEAIRLKEEKQDIRPPYFRDADRIIYSLAYTRYINKTQVYTDAQNDNITRRITHVQMVSKVARTIGRALKLNEDLIEAAALGHDLGHPPFGHEGEYILNKISLEVNEGYFNHNIQSVRNLMNIDHQGNGDNISIQVLDAIMCHNGELELKCYKPHSKTPKNFLEEYNNSYKIENFTKTLIPMTLEGCVVRISDIIAYLGRDIEDALRLHKLHKEDIPKDIFTILSCRNSEIINYFVLDIIKNSYGKNYIQMSDEAFNLLKKIKKFNYDKIYKNANSPQTKKHWEQMIRTIFSHYLKDLQTNNEKSHIYIFFYKYMNAEYKKNTSKERVVIDYIAGMTDDFLKKEYEYITNYSKI